VNETLRSFFDMREGGHSLHSEIKVSELHVRCRGGIRSRVIQDRRKKKQSSQMWESQLKMT